MRYSIPLLLLAALAIVLSVLYWVQDGKSDSVRSAESFTAESRSSSLFQEPAASGSSDELPSLPYEDEDAPVSQAVVSGSVVDATQQPLANAVVSCDGQTGRTDERGRFSLTLNAQGGACTPLRVEKPGFWRQTARLYLERTGQTEVCVMLRKREEARALDSQKGGKLEYDGFAVELPPDGVETADGKPYSGRVLVEAEGALPSAKDFGQRMPGGDFAGKDSAGRAVTLLSYGFLTAELKSEEGEPLKLRQGSRATLRFKAPKDKVSPDRIPLWHFNETTAIWEQEGWATRRGEVYEGGVSHFSSWNLDLPSQRATVWGRVVDCEGKALAGAQVRVGQRLAYANGEGFYRAFVPAGVAVSVLTQLDSLIVPGIAAQESRELETLRSRPFHSAVAFWNRTRHRLLVCVNGPGADRMRFSIDRGVTWTDETSFDLKEPSVKEVRYAGGCSGTMPVKVIESKNGCTPWEKSALDAQLDTLIQRHSIRTYRRFCGSTYTVDHEMFREHLKEFPEVNTYFLIGGAGIDWNEQVENMFILPCLQALYLQNARILPSEIGRLSELRIIDQIEISSNIRPSSEFSNTAGRKFIEFNGRAANSLNSIPATIGALSQLEFVNLNNGKLESLPESFSRLENLQYLGLSRNKLRFLPIRFGDLKNLQTLELQSNELIELPESFSMLAELRQLDLSSNRLINVQRSFGKSSKLERLNLHNNRINRLPDSLGTMVVLKELTVHQNRIWQLPASIGQLRSLERLILANNKLESLPESFGALTSLQELDLSKNRLVLLPPSFQRLKRLRRLVASANLLASCPPGLSGMTDLQELEMTFNHIRELPEDLGKLRKLEKLNLKHNRLERLPQSVCDLAALKSLNLSQNQLLELPPEFGRLAALEQLDLSDNRLTDLPPSIASLAGSLKALNVAGNPIPLRRRKAIEALLPQTRIRWR